MKAPSSLRPQPVSKAPVLQQPQRRRLLLIVPKTFVGGPGPIASSPIATSTFQLPLGLDFGVPISSSSPQQHSQQPQATPVPAPIASPPPPAAPSTRNKPHAEAPFRHENEDFRRDFRTVYNWEDWQSHRSPMRYFVRGLLTYRSHIMRNIIPAMVWVAAVSVALGTYVTAGVQGMLPLWLPLHGPMASAAASTFISHTTVALSLLLVFRTNSSYSRWDEARKMWGSLLNRSRDLMRMSVTIFPDGDAASKGAMGRWIIAFAHALRVHFQPETSLDSKVRPVLRAKELQLLLDARQRPLQAIHVMSQIIMNVPINAVHQAALSANLTHFHDTLGGCERLFRAPIPLSYTRHTARCLFLYLTVLPFALWNSCGWATPPVAVAIAGVLCGVEEIGVQCEEPFGILPLEMLVSKIAEGVRDTLATDTATKAVLADLVAE